MAVSEDLKLALLRYRARGGRMYRLAIDAGMTPSMLSATISGARNVDYDARIVGIGERLGLTADQCFVADSDRSVAL